MITGCVVDHCCSTKSPGGSLYILQNCSAIVHNSIFNFSHTASSNGGAIFAANSIDDREENFYNDRIESLDIQYCCFQNCFGDGGKVSKLYGVAVFFVCKK